LDLIWVQYGYLANKKNQLGGSCGMPKLWVQYGYLANKKNQLGGSCGMPKLKQVPLISWTITCTKRHTHQRAKGEMEQWLGSITPIYQGYVVLESSEPFIQL